jgi:hypothetical protein
MELTRQWSGEGGGTRIVKKVKERNRDGIFKRRKSPGIDFANSKEKIPQAYVAWKAGTTNRFIVPARQST